VNHTIGKLKMTEADLIPPDTERCQAMKPNGEGPFTLGGGYKMIRCTNAPTVILYEDAPGKDGLCGSMSLCPECLEQFKKQIGLKGHTVKPVYDTWTATVLEDPNDPEGAVFQFPPDMIAKLGWKEGDQLSWDPQPNGTVVLRKVTEVAG
jgi:hypothetical protein